MTKRNIRFFSRDQTSLGVLALLVVLLALGGVKVGQEVGTRLLRDDGQDTTMGWATSLTKNTSGIANLVHGGQPSAAMLSFLKDASRVGDIYRYRIWSATGTLVFDSTEGAAAVPIAFDEQRWQGFLVATRSGVPSTDSYAGLPPENPGHFVVSYIPIRENGAVIGCFEVYLDQTADYALYHGSLHLTEVIIAIAVLLAGGLPGFMVHRKMQDYRKSQAETLYLAEHDALTGVANRNQLEAATRRELAWNRRRKTYVAVLLIDLDRFKEVNDGLGHTAGDDLLRQFARRLSSNVRAEDTVARLGGDEFVILQVGMDQPDGAIFLTTRLMETLSQPYDIGGVKVTCAASIGIAMAPTDAEEWDPLLSHADAALYRAKAEGRNTVCFYEAGMASTQRERRRLELELRRALELKAFRLAYQPVIRFSDGRLLGFEALLRWPEGWEPESPSTFIPIAEAYGLIVPIGAWTLETACRAAAAWKNPLRVAVNLSPVQFRHGDIVATVKDALQTTGLDPTRLELEVTESLWLQHTDTVRDKLMQLRAMGVSIALDDFGTGYSSLTYLWQFSFDTVKIDRSFVMGMEADPKAAAIVNTIVSLGRTIDLTVAAEGVETPAQAELLQGIGCDQAQGYLFSRPLDVASATALADACPTSTFLVAG